MEILPETLIAVAIVIFGGYTIFGATGFGASPITIAPEMDLGIHDAQSVSPYSSTVGFSPDDRSIAIESILWSSDWPHPSEQAKQLPDDAILFDLLSDWVPDGNG
jgi:hypothetical protein